MLASCSFSYLPDYYARALPCRVKRPAGGPMTMMYLLSNVSACGNHPRIYDDPLVPWQSHSLPSARLTDPCKVGAGDRRHKRP